MLHHDSPVLPILKAIYGKFLAKPSEPFFYAPNPVKVVKVMKVVNR